MRNSILDKTEISAWLFGLFLCPKTNNVSLGHIELLIGNAFSLLKNTKSILLK